jgi:hypothetical protein
MSRLKLSGAGAPATSLSLAAREASAPYAKPDADSVASRNVSQQATRRRK